jgi:pyruvate formate lyase activating enzyme
MQFGGIQKTSLIDFPSKIATVLFAPFCNLRCPYCHNWRLIVDPKPPFLDEEKALSILESRKKYVDAVVITGGEPTLQNDLPRFIKKLKESGFMVKLDTNGFFPHVLEQCLPYLDFVALDVKTSLEKYPLLGAVDINNYLRSIELLKKGKVEYEFRNTVVPGFVDKEDIPKIGELVNGGKCFVFQRFIPDDTLDKSYRDVKPYPNNVILDFANLMKRFVENVMLRI